MKKTGLFVLGLMIALVNLAVAVPTSGTVQFSSIATNDPNLVGEWDKINKKLDFPVINSDNPQVNSFVVTATGDFEDYFIPSTNGVFTLGNSVATFYDFSYGNSFTAGTIWSSDDIVGSLDGLVSFSMTSITKTIESLSTGTTTIENGILTSFVPNPTPNASIDSLRIFGVGEISVDGDAQTVKAEMTFEGGGNLTFSWSSTTTVVPDESSTLSLFFFGLVSLATAFSKRNT